MKIFLFGALLALTARAAFAGLADRRLDIYYVDTEGGAATLIVSPAGQSVLIDAGENGTRDPSRIAQVAKAAGLEKIDFLIVTHFHLDHFGGAADLSHRIGIGQLYDNGMPYHGSNGAYSAVALKSFVHDADHDDPVYWPTVSRYFAFPTSGRHLVYAGLVIPLRQPSASPSLRLRCLAARQEFVPPPPGGRPNPLAQENTAKSVPLWDDDNCSAWVLDFGPFRFFDGGDLTWNMEGRLVAPINRVGQVDVYQVDHHGLDTSNNPVLVHSLAPTVSVMNNGSDKGTEPSTMSALRSSPGIQAMYQLRKNLRQNDPQDNTSDDEIASFAPFAPNLSDGPACYIKVSVSPEGRSYTVTLSRTGRARTFATRLDKAAD